MGEMGPPQPFKTRRWEANLHVVLTGYVRLSVTMAGTGRCGLIGSALAGCLYLGLLASASRFHPGSRSDVFGGADDEGSGAGETPGRL